MPHIETTPRPPALRISDGVRAAEELLIDIIDAVREPLLVLDPEFRVTHANRSFFRAFRVDAQRHDRQGPLHDRRRPVGHSRRCASCCASSWRAPGTASARSRNCATSTSITCSRASAERRCCSTPRSCRADRMFPRIILLAIEDVTERRARRTATRRAAPRARAVERGAGGIRVDRVARSAGAAAQDPRVRRAPGRLGGTGARGRRTALPRSNAQRSRTHAHVDHRPAHLLADHDARPAVRRHEPRRRGAGSHRRSRDGHRRRRRPRGRRRRCR